MLDPARKVVHNLVNPISFSCARWSDTIIGVPVKAASRKSLSQGSLLGLVLLTFALIVSAIVYFITRAGESTDSQTIKDPAAKEAGDVSVVFHEPNIDEKQRAAICVITRATLGSKTHLTFEERTQLDSCK